MGNCIGERNYGLFLSFLLAAACYTLYVCAFCVAELALRTRETLAASRAGGPASRATMAAAAAKDPYALRTDTVLGAFFASVTVCPAALVLAMYTLVVAVLLAMLGAYHVYLISINETTNENVKDLYYDGNPFNESCARNWGQVVCGLRGAEGTELGLEPAADDVEGGGSAAAMATEHGHAHGGLSQAHDRDQPLPPAVELDASGSARAKRFQATLRRLSGSEVELVPVKRGAPADAGAGSAARGEGACARGGEAASIEEGEEEEEADAGGVRRREERRADDEADGGAAAGAAARLRLPGRGASESACGNGSGAEGDAGDGADSDNSASFATSTKPLLHQRAPSLPLRAQAEACSATSSTLGAGAVPSRGASSQVAPGQRQQRVRGAAAVATSGTRDVEAAALAEGEESEDEGDDDELETGRQGRRGGAGAALAMRHRREQYTELAG